MESKKIWNGNSATLPHCRVRDFITLHQNREYVDGVWMIVVTVAKKKWNFLSFYFHALFLYIESGSIHILLQVKIIYNLRGERAL